MKRFILITLALFAGMQLFAQRNADFGLIAGGASYFGEINPVRPFYKPSPAIGGFYRLNFNKRFSARVNTTFISLKGDASDFSGQREYHYLQNTSFSSSFVEVCGQAEFNFIDYITGDSKYLSSTYIAGGIGYLFPKKGIVIPFSVGAKVNLGERLSMGAELSFRKTFTDEIDENANPLDNTFMNNNDWYSIFGLFISYKFVKFAADCPVYN